MCFARPTPHPDTEVYVWSMHEPLLDGSDRVAVRSDLLLGLLRPVSGLLRIRVAFRLHVAETQRIAQGSLVLRNVWSSK